MSVTRLPERMEMIHEKLLAKTVVLEEKGKLV
jgi:hypothetical protein